MLDMEIRALLSILALMEMRTMLNLLMTANSKNKILFWLEEHIKTTFR
jgi:hypothetical protein